MTTEQMDWLDDERAGRHASQRGFIPFDPESGNEPDPTFPSPAPDDSIPMRVPVWEQERAEAILKASPEAGTFGSPNLLPNPSLTFMTSSQPPMIYRLDMIAAHILDARRKNPEGTFWLDMPARDRAIAVALLKLALEVLDA